MMLSLMKYSLIFPKTSCAKLPEMFGGERKKRLPAEPGSARLRLLSSNAGGRGPDGSSMSSEQEQL